MREKKYKGDYEYSGDQISRVTMNRWDNNDEVWELFYDYYFYYDTDGFLIEQKGDDIHYTCTYEVGNGNANLFYSRPEFLVSNYPHFE